MNVNADNTTVASTGTVSISSPSHDLRRREGVGSRTSHARRHGSSVCRDGLEGDEEGEGVLEARERKKRRRGTGEGPLAH
jgi:hypothetical protein